MATVEASESFVYSVIGQFVYNQVLKREIYVIENLEDLKYCEHTMHALVRAVFMAHNISLMLEWSDMFNLLV